MKNKQKMMQEVAPPGSVAGGSGASIMKHVQFETITKLCTKLKAAKMNQKSEILKKYIRKFYEYRSEYLAKYPSAVSPEYRL